MTTNILVRDLKLQPYETVWNDMREFTQSRTASTSDEIWLVEHHPVFTLGLNGKDEHILSAGDIPVVKCDRGGQVTYHGPGQVVIYLMLALNNYGMGVKQLVNIMEQAVIDLLAGFAISAERRENAPGVYVDNAKIAALGLRVRRGFSYHGLSLNVDMDLGPFALINPCGYPGLASVQLKDLVGKVDMEKIKQGLVTILHQKLQQKLQQNLQLKQQHKQPS